MQKRSVKSDPYHGMNGTHDVIGHDPKAVAMEAPRPEHPNGVRGLMLMQLEQALRNYHRVRRIGKSLFGSPLPEDTPDIEHFNHMSVEQLADVLYNLGSETQNYLDEYLYGLRG